MALQLMENGGKLGCVDFGSVLISAAMGAITPGLGNTRKALQAASSARAAIVNLEGQLARAQTSSRAARVTERIARNQQALYDANTTVIQQVSGSAGAQVFKAVQASTPLRFGNNCGCGKN